MPKQVAPQQAALERAYRRALRWATEQSARKLEAAAALTASAEGWMPPNPDEVYDLNAAIKRLRSETTKPRRNLVNEVARTYSLDVNNPLIESVFEQLGMHITRIAEDQRASIMAAIDSAWADGLSIPNTKELIIAASRDLSASRATTIARTEMIGAVNGGSLAAVRAGGAAAYKQWLATQDDRTREDHVDIDGTVIPVDEAFDVGGSQMMFPGDPNGDAGEVVNCRCTLVYSDSPEGLTAAASMIGGAMATTAEPDVQAEADQTAAPASQRWEATLYEEGTPTVDGRMIDKGATEWRDLPLTLYYLNDIPEWGHIGAVAVGRIESISRQGDKIIAAGSFDSTAEADEASRMVGEQVITGISVDLAPLTVELRVKPELLADPIDGVEAEAADTSGDAVVVDKMNVDDVMDVVTRGMIVSATIVGQPAATEGKIALVASAHGIDHWIIEGGFVAAAVADPEAVVTPPEAPGSAPVTLGADPQGVDPLTLVAGVLRGLSEGAMMGSVLRGVADALTASSDAAKPDPLMVVLEQLSAGRQADREQLALVASALRDAALAPPGDLHVHTPPVTVETGSIDVHPADLPPINLTVEGQKPMRFVRDGEGRLIGTEIAPGNGHVDEPVLPKLTTKARKSG